MKKERRMIRGREERRIKGDRVEGSHRSFHSSFQNVASKAQVPSTRSSVSSVPFARSLAHTHDRSKNQRPRLHGSLFFFFSSTSQTPINTNHHLHQPPDDRLVVTPPFSLSFLFFFSWSCGSRAAWRCEEDDVERGEGHAGGASGMRWRRGQEREGKRRERERAGLTKKA